MVYLLNISVSGVKSIEKEVRLDFYKKTVDNNFNPDKYRIKAIYGENGSGKSAIITAVKIFRDLIIKDNYLNESQTQVFLDEIINKTTKAFRFGCEFLVRAVEPKTVYNYSVYIGKGDSGLYEIQSEVLKEKSGNYQNNRYTTVFESRNGELLSVNCSGNQKKILEKKSMNLLSSCSFVHICLVNNLKYMDANVNPINREFLINILFPLVLTLMIQVYLDEEDQHELYFWGKKLKEGKLGNQILKKEGFEYEELTEAFFSVNEKAVNKGIFNEYKKRVERLTQFLKIFKQDLISIDIDAKEKGDQYECDLNLNYGSYSINKEFESTGIKKLIRLFDCFLAASTWGIVFIDEMDSNLNDVYLCKLIEYFMYYGKGQLCFTTHNLDPMSILKKNKNSIDFLSSDNHLVPWTSRGNASPENCYKNGMIEDLPFNIEASDFVGIFGE